MKSKLLILLSIVFVLIRTNSIGGVDPNQPKTINSVLKDFHHSGFESNNGQMKDSEGNPVPFILYKTETSGLQFYITLTGITYIFYKKENETHRNLKLQDSETDSSGIISAPLRFHFNREDAILSGADIRKENIELVGIPSNDHKNYFYPNNPQGIYNVHEVSKIKIKNVYPGINWVLYFNSTGVKYDFEILPGANPDLIKIIYRGAAKISLDTDGNIQVKSDVGSVTEEKPFSFQDGKKIKSQFILVNDSTVKFSIGSYNHSQKLIIDPQLVWSTAFGGYLPDYFRSVTVDKFGNLFATGFTSSPDFPNQSSGNYYDGLLTGQYDVMIVKFNSNYVLQWSTFYGGTSNSSLEEGTAIKSDAAGNIFVTGFTSSFDFPVQSAGGYGASYMGSFEAFLLKFQNNGTRLFASFIGGSSSDLATDLDIDNNGDVFICGNTTSSNFPIVAGTGFNDNTYNTNDGFLMKFSNSTNLLWSTFLGGSSIESIASIACDNSNNLFVTGTTSSSNFPLQNNGNYFDGTINGTTDFFISKFNSAQTLIWSTFYGGAGSENAASIATDEQGNIMAGGSTNSQNFPTYSSGSSYSDSQLGNGAGFETDAAYVKFDNNGVRLWASYFGGTSAENFFDVMGSAKYDFDNQIIADKCGNFYVSLVTNSSDMPTVNSGCTTYYDDNLSNGQDAFLAKFSKENILRWSTYIGGNPDAEVGLALTLDNYNNLLAAGCNDTSFGLPYLIYGNAYYDNYSTNNMDAFLMLFKQPSMNAGVNSSLCSGGCSGSASVLINSSCTFGYTYQWNNGLTTQNASSLCVGNYSVIVTDTINCALDTLNFTLSSGINITPDVTPWSCNFACTGSASVTVPGISNATYFWNNGSTASSINGICPGNYSVTVTSAGCGSDIENFTITIPPPLYLFINSIIPPTQDCQGLCDASATVVYTGGATIPYIFWANGTTGTTVDSLCPNSTILVTAGDSLCYTTTIDVPIPSTPVFQILYFYTQDACICDGTAEPHIINSSGGVLQYLWSNGATTAIVDSLCPGNYSLIVTDPLCGPDTASFTIYGSIPIDIYNLIDHTSDCPIPCSGNVQYFINQGVVGPLTFVWTNGTNIVPAYNLCIDSTYYVTVTDGCGNTDSDSITIVYNPYPYGCYIVPDVFSCPNVCDGVAHTQIYGGTYPFTYAWSTGSNTSVGINLCPGTLYSVTVTDVCGTTRQCNQVFPQASYPDLEMGQSPSCLEACSGVAYAYLTGGIAPYHFIWSDGETTDLINDVCADSTYWVTVTDACNHADSDFIVIEIADQLFVSVDYSFDVCPLLCDGYAQVFTNGGTPPIFLYMEQWRQR